MHWRFRHVDKLTDLVVLDALEVYTCRQTNRSGGARCMGGLDM